MFIEIGVLSNSMKFYTLINKFNHSNLTKIIQQISVKHTNY
jgi:hypothetical protein